MVIRVTFSVELCTNTKKKNDYPVSSYINKNHEEFKINNCIIFIRVDIITMQKMELEEVLFEYPEIMETYTETISPELAQAQKSIDDFFAATSPEQGHPIQVCKLALSIFDGMSKTVEFTPLHRFVLANAALLHDLGWFFGQKGHHKNSMKMIMAAKLPGLDSHTKKMIAVTARYHRKNMPDKSHEIYGRFSKKDQEAVNLLSGILRIADGLDNSHVNNVLELTAEMAEPNKLLLNCLTKVTYVAEFYAAQKKSDLLREMCGISTLVSFRIDTTSHSGK